MGQIVIGNKNNTYTYSFNAAAKTLAISGIVNFSVADLDLLSVYDTTTASFFILGGYTAFVVTTNANGIPIYTWTFQNVPAGSANGDTLVILLGCPDIFMEYTILQQLLAVGGVSLTTNGNFGAATLVGSTLNIPNYSSVIIGTPTVVTDVGAGTGGVVSVVHNGKVLLVTLSVGSSTAGGNAIVFTVTFPTPIPYQPYPVFSPASSNAALLMDGGATLHKNVYISAADCSTTSISLRSGGTAIPQNTGGYVWHILI